MNCRLLSILPEETIQKYVSLRREHTRLCRESNYLYNDCLILNNKMDIYDARFDDIKDVSILKKQMIEMRLERLELNQRWLKIKSSCEKIENEINDIHKEIFKCLIHPGYESRWDIAYEDRKSLYDASKIETSWKVLAESSVLIKELIDCI